MFFFPDVASRKIFYGRALYQSDGVLSILPLTKVMFCTLSGEAANFANSFCMRVSKLFMDELCLWVRCVGVRVCVCVCKRRWMRVCATPATSCSSWLANYCPTTPVRTSAGETNTGRRIRTKRATQCHLSHACHAKRRWMRVSATPATLLFLLACQLLPHDTGADKRRRSKHRATNPDQARHPVPSVPRLPRKTTVDVTLCHACTSLCM